MQTQYDINPSGKFVGLFPGRYRTERTAAESNRGRSELGRRADGTAMMAGLGRDLRRRSGSYVREPDLAFV
jgi:hypothetical protein